MPTTPELDNLPAPKSPCTRTVYTLTLKKSLYRYFGAQVYTILTSPMSQGKERLNFQIATKL